MLKGEKRNIHSVKKLYTVSAATLATLVSLGFINASAQADDQPTNQSTATTEVASQTSQNQINSQSQASSSTVATTAATDTSSTTSAAPAVTATTQSKVAVNTSTQVASSADTIDISAYQKNMSVGTFQNYKNMGVQNVVVKLTESTGWTNGYAQSQINNARAVE